MTLSVASNATLAQNHVSQQKTGIDKEQTEKSRSNPSSDKNISEHKFDDNVTLSQSEKTNGPSEIIEREAAEKLLPQTMKSILANSKTAVSAQANTTPQAAREFLTE